jgi:hypothetical protein
MSKPLPPALRNLAHTEPIPDLALWPPHIRAWVEAYVGAQLALFKSALDAALAALAKIEKRRQTNLAAPAIVAACDADLAEVRSLIEAGVEFMLDPIHDARPLATLDAEARALFERGGQEMATLLRRELHRRLDLA